MTEKYKESVQLKNGVTLKNRILMAPMTNRMSFHNGDVTKDELAYYALRTGEVGAIITAAANVQDDGKGWDGEFGVSSDDHLASLKSLSSTIQKGGTKAIIQLFHGGRMTNSQVLRGTQPVSASAIPAEREDAEIPRALEENEILKIIESFMEATVRSYEAGFDGVELHGANTYLIQQFFSPHSNRRDDQWGGNLENRYRFVEKLVDDVLEVTEEFERPFAVGYRFSPEEYETPGIRMDDTMFLVDKLADKNLDYLHISLNEYDRISISDDYKKESILKYVHDKINERVPLIGVGGVQNQEDLENTLKDSEFVALGRSLLTEPHWVSKVFNNREDQLRLTISPEDFPELGITRGLSTALFNMMPDQIT